MRLLLFTSGLLAIAAALPAPVQAQNYPWCVTYAGSMGGGRNCGFVSMEQCLETATGAGGSCDINTQYVPPAGASGAQVRRQPRHR